jgi:hypothetical protein
MNPSSIYSKTGKGVQEASGKTSHLSRGDRAILSAIDGKITLKELAGKFDRAPDDKFFALIRKMDQDGFIREVSPGTVQRGAANAPRPSAPPSMPSKPAPKSTEAAGEDLDFTQIFSAPPKLEKPAAPPSRPAAPPSDPMAAARQEAEMRARAEREAKARAEAVAKAASEAGMKDRLEAEARAKAERELKMQAAAEGTTTAEIQARARAEADAKVRAAVEAKAREEAEAREKAAAEARARIEEKRRAEEAERAAKERAERELREKAEAAERSRFEAAERARREAEDLRLKLEEERRAREEAERRAREEAERTRREAAERARREAEEKKAREEAEALRKKLDEERRAREEAERKAEEERQRRERQRLEELRKLQEEEDARRRKEEEAERKVREAEDRREAEEHQRQIRLAREAEDKKRRDADARKRKEEEARRWEAEEARRKSDEAYRVRAEQEDRERAEREVAEAAERAAVAKKAAQEADALSNALFADLDSFAQREEQERKSKEEQDKLEREERLRKAKEDEERKAREEEERKARKEEEKRRREEEEQRQKEEEERLARELEARRKEEEEARLKKKREEEARKAATQGDIPISRADHGMGDVQEDMRKLTPEARKALRDRQREVARAQKRGDEPTAKAASAYRRKQPVKWGKPVAIALFVLLAAGVGVLNLMPLSTAEYEKLAAEAIGQPVKIGSARMWVLAGVQMRFENVVIGEGVKIAQVRAVPELGSVFGDQKVFSRIELEKVVLPQEALGGALFGALQGRQFFARRVVATEVKLEGPLALPPVSADAAIGGDGKVAEVKLSGDRLTGLVTPRGDGVMFELTIASFTLPFLNKFSLTEFGAKGTANRQGMTVSEFDGRVYDGTMAGNARIQWGATWSVSGEVRGGGMNAGVFAPSLVSEGRFEGKGRYVMAGKEAERLYETARLDGSFTVARGTLSSFDLSRALQTTSAQASGRTQFTELTGQASLASGTLSLRDMRLTAGLLNATGTLDVEPAGNLAGRINAELRNLRGTFFIGGKLTEPQLRR